MTTQLVRRVGVPLAVALAVLAVVLGVSRLAGPAGEGRGDGQSGSSGGPRPASSTPTAAGTADPDAPMSRFSSVSPGPDGRSLEVRFWGGVDTCYRYRVDADETGEEVALTLREKTTFDGACIDLAKEYARTVPLTEDLGVRKVVDAVTGEVLLAPSP